MKTKVTLSGALFGKQSFLTETVRNNDLLENKQLILNVLLAFYTTKGQVKKHLRFPNHTTKTKLYNNHSWHILKFDIFEIF